MCFNKCVVLDENREPHFLGLFKGSLVLICPRVTVKSRYRVDKVAWYLSQSLARFLSPMSTEISIFFLLRCCFSLIKRQFVLSLFNKPTVANKLDLWCACQLLPGKKIVSKVFPAQSPHGQPQLALITNPYSSHSFSLTPPSLFGDAYYKCNILV